MNISRRFAVSGLAGLGLVIATLAQAADPVVVTLTIKDHRFTPQEVEVPAGQQIKLVVKNMDKTPEEFESKSLRREKVIPGGAEATILVGPLKPGKYTFYGEFHESTAKGALIAK
jgi:plastocyanin